MGRRKLVISKVLYITYDGLTDPLGQSQILPYLRALSKKGHRITVLSFEKPPAYEKSHQDIAQMCVDAEIDWSPLVYHRTPPVLSTLYDIRALKTAAFKIAKKKNIDVVHCRSYIAAIAGLKLKRQLDIKFLFDMRGFWADERVEGNLWNPKNPVFSAIYKYFKRLETAFLLESDAVVSLTETGKREILDRSIEIDAKKFYIIPCCADFDHFDYRKYSQASRDRMRSKVGLNENALVFSYLGSTGTWYMLDEMLEFFALACSVDEMEKQFFFITRDSPVDIRNRAAKFGIEPERIVVASANRSEVPEMLSASDIGLFFIKPSFSKKASSPTKLAEYSGMGLPVICNRNVGDLDALFKDQVLGLAIDLTDRGQWLHAIKQVPKMVHAPANKIREKGIATFDLNHGVETYDRIYKTLLAVIE